MRLPQGWKRAKQTDTTHKVELEKSKTSKVGLGQFTTSLYPNWNEFIHFLCFCGGGLDFDFILMPQPTSFFFIFSSLFSFALPQAHKQINDLSTCYINIWWKLQTQDNFLAAFQREYSSSRLQLV